MSKPSYMRISKKLWNKTEQAHANAIENYIELKREYKNLRDESDSLQAAYSVAMNELEPLKANHASLGELFELAKGDRDRAIKCHSVAVNERDDARNALRLANERMTKIAGESEGLLIRNKELSTKLLFYVELARRICTLG